MPVKINKKSVSEIGFWQKGARRWQVIRNVAHKISALPRNEKILNLSGMALNCLSAADLSNLLACVPSHVTTLHLSGNHLSSSVGFWQEALQGLETTNVELLIGSSHMKEAIGEIKAVGELSFFVERPLHYKIEDEYESTFCCGF